MKTISRIAIGAAVVLLVAATVQPSNAACATPRLMNNIGAYLVSNPAWGGAGADRSCGGGYPYGYGCYLSEAGGPPISSSIAGVFWGFDTNLGASAADPAIGLGIDNGGWGVDQWTKSRFTDQFAERYYYAAFLTLDVAGEPNSVAGNPANWSFPVDGCTGDIDPNSCTCILLTDQWGGEGYFMIDSAITDAGGDYQFNGDFPGDGLGAPTMLMAAIPAPSVVLSERDPASGDVTMTIDGGSLAAADYRDAGCDCGVGYIVYQQIVARGGAAPADRSIAAGGWIPAPNATGGAQAATDFGAQATIKVDCDPAVQQDIYLATAIVEESGLVTDNVSGNSFRIECGANLAEPNRPDRTRGRSADAPRGRENNRGQRDR